MSNFGPFQSNQVNAVPTPPSGEVVARYATYLQAQRAVDFLSDSHFPVQFVTIVGTDLRMVERVTGRLTYGRVAVAGAASGAWFGLFVGLVLSLFSTGKSFSLLAAILIGAGFGMLFGVISFSFTRGKRDFTSTSQIVATEYQVLCLEEHAGAARQLLQKLAGGSGLDGPYGGPGAGPTAPATITPPPYSPPTVPQPTQQPVEQVTPEPSGPTYGEMIDRQRKEREEAERRARTEDQPG